MIIVSSYNIYIYVMKKIIILILSVVLICFACKSEEEKNPDSNLLIEQLLSEIENQQEDNKNETEDTVEYYYEDGEDSLYEEAEIGSTGNFPAVFKYASLVSGIVALHFNNMDSGEEVFYTVFDIDPKKEGLFTYKKIEDSFFPELVTNPEIKDVVFKLYWEVERREVELVGWTNIEVLKKIEQLDKLNLQD